MVGIGEDFPNGKSPCEIAELRVVGRSEGKLVLPKVERLVEVTARGTNGPSLTGPVGNTKVEVGGTETLEIGSHSSVFCFFGFFGLLSVPLVRFGLRGLFHH